MFSGQVYIFSSTADRQLKTDGVKWEIAFFVCVLLYPSTSAQLCFNRRHWYVLRKQIKHGWLLWGSLPKNSGPYLPCSKILSANRKKPKQRSTAELVNDPHPPQINLWDEGEPGGKQYLVNTFYLALEIEQVSTI